MKTMKYMRGTAVIAFCAMLFTASVALGETIKEGDSADEVKNASPAAAILSPAVNQTEKPKIYSKSKERLISIVTERAQILQSRWEALALRLDNISERISSRMSKMEEAGYDISEAGELLEKADSKIEDARDKFKETVAIMVSEAEDSDGTAKDLYRIEKEVINPGKEAVAVSFNEAKETLNDVIKALLKSEKAGVSN